MTELAEGEAGQSVKLSGAPAADLHEIDATSIDLVIKPVNKEGSAVTHEIMPEPSVSSVESPSPPVIKAKENKVVSGRGEPNMQ